MVQSMNGKPVRLNQFVVWLGAVRALRSQHPFSFLLELSQSSAPVFFFRYAGEKVYFFNDPDLVKEILVTNHAKLQKGRGLERAKRTLGNGLLTSEGELHRQQRRLIQPIFNHRNLQAYAKPMVDRAAILSASWNDAQPVNVTAAMTALTLSIVCQTLFGLEIDRDATRVRELLAQMTGAFPLLMGPFGGLLTKLGHARVRNGLAAREELHVIVRRLIDQRRSSPDRTLDLLSLLFAAQDEETGTRMSDQQIEDEAMTIFLAGHETTATALSWTFYLLAQHPEFDYKLRTQLNAILGDNPPSAAQLAELTLLDELVHESLRLYPPAWIIGRRATEDLQIGGTHIPKRSLLIVSPWVMHRSARYYVRPTEMNPDRWTESFRKQLPKYAYFPFGGGPRQCIGEGFAWMELKLILAVLMRDWRVELMPGQDIRPKPAMTLKSNHPIHMIVHRV
jgi:cytochrome P450